MKSRSISRLDIIGYASPSQSPEMINVVPDLLFLILFSLTWLYNYFCKNFNLFLQQGVPGPKPIPIFGTWWNCWKHNAHEIDQKRFKEYGPVYYSIRGRNPVLHVQDLNLLRYILINDSQESFSGRDRRPVVGERDEVNNTLSMLHGEQWKVVRKLVMSGFSNHVIKERLQFANESILGCLDYWDSLLDNKNLTGKMDLRIEMEGLCAEVMVNHIAGIRLGAIGNPNHPYVLNARKVMEGGERGLFWTLAQLYPSLARWFFPVVHTGNEYFVNLSKKILRGRLGEKVLHHRTEVPDMIDKLVRSMSSDVKENDFIDESVAIAQTTSSILTGYDVGTVLMRVLHCLTLHPHIQTKCRQEIANQSGKYEGGGVTFALLNDLPYLDQCIKEAVRLYPTIFKTFRHCTKDKEYRDLFIPKGTVIEIPVYFIQRNKEFYPDPLKFDPERVFKEFFLMLALICVRQRLLSPPLSFSILSLPINTIKL